VELKDRGEREACLSYQSPWFGGRNFLLLHKLCFGCFAGVKTQEDTRALLGKNGLKMGSPHFSVPARSAVTEFYVSENGDR